MSASSEVHLAPVRSKARIDVLDILRGLAILGIFFINVPYMAANVQAFSSDIRVLGWSPADRTAWAAVQVLLAGTQRCMLEFLFGAGMMVLARKAMEPEGPVAVSDLYYRRNLWLLAFGLFDVFFLLWPGDILHIYALAALFLFPFRRLAPRMLVGLGLIWAVLFAAGIPEHGVREYLERSALVSHVRTAEAHEAAGEALTPSDHAALDQWRKAIAAERPAAETLQAIAHERQAHAGGWLPYARRAWDSWSEHVQEWLVWDVLEAWGAMMIGVALWKWRIIQGGRDRRFYLLLMLAGYGFGITARVIGIGETFRFSPEPRILWITGEFARLAVGLGHVALVNYAVQTRLGNALLAPFKAAGRMAFSLYFLQQFVGMYIVFSPFGLNLWGRFGWAEMAAISTIGVVLQVVLANLWFRTFASGPLEWLWRSLAYLQRQPLLRPVSAPPQPGLASPSALSGGGAA